ncbi:MAG TPA: GerMN domain-containing protein [Terriglobales bacterium]|nr:GerMN domain-containing protein [Terriglobales bacterium]
MIPRPLKFGIAAMALVALVIGFFAGRERRLAHQTEPSVTESRPVAPPPSGATEQVTLYVAYVAPGVLLPQSSVIPLPSGRQQRAEELLHALMDIYAGKTSQHPLGPGADIRNVYLVDPGLAVIDINTAFASGHRSGILVEELTVVSLVETLTANIPGITRVKILVNGKEQDTLAGHADLSRIYEAASAGDLLNQMRAQ